MGLEGLHRKLNNRIKAFDTRRLALLNEMQALDPTQLIAKPVADKWSILEIIEHLVVAEREVLKGLPEPWQLTEQERRFKHRLAFFAVLFVLRWGIPVQVPSPTMVPRGSHSLAELRLRWDENQEWLRTYVAGLDREGFRKAVFEHPIAGPLSVGQAVHMDQLHLRTHIRQIRRLQDLLN